MKLMRWVEVHITRSRRKGKKERGSKEGTVVVSGQGSSPSFAGNGPADSSLDGSGSLRVLSPWSSGDMTTSSPNLTTTIYRWKNDDETQDLDDSVLLDSLDTDDLHETIDSKPLVIPVDNANKNQAIKAVQAKCGKATEKSLANSDASLNLNEKNSNQLNEKNANQLNNNNNNNLNNNNNNGKRPPLQIKTSFQETSVQDVGSPRQRTRIKTNPWLPSPRSSCCSSSSSGDSGWSGTRSSGSDSPETIEGFGSGNSVFGSQSSATPWCGWSSVTSLRSNRESSPAYQVKVKNTALKVSSRDKLAFEARKVTSLERRGKFHGLWAEKEVDRLLLLGADRLLELPVPPVQRRGHPAKHDPRSRSLPRVEWAFPPETKAVCPLAEGDSSEPDEAYSEDFVQSEDQEDEGKSVGYESRAKEAISPQADSACSCSTTPSSEIEPRTSVPVESLEDKVRRLRSEQRQVEEKMKEAREDEQRRREERLLCQQEMVHFRRLLLIRTLQELRTRLELQGERLHRAYSATLDMKQEWQEDRWSNVE